MARLPGIQAPLVEHDPPFPRRGIDRSADAVITGLSGLENARARDLRVSGIGPVSYDSAHERSRRFDHLRHLPEVRPPPQLIVDNPAYAFARVAQQFFASHTGRAGSRRTWFGVSTSRIGEILFDLAARTIGRSRGNRRASDHFPRCLYRAMIRWSAMTLPCTRMSSSGRAARSEPRDHFRAAQLIGSDGFRYVQHDGQHHKIPQLGGVTIEVMWNWARTSPLIAPTLGQFVVKRGTKIDNLVEITHNVTVVNTISSSRR